MANKPPFFRLSLFYFFYFAALGIFVPYWSVYLKYIHFNALQTGQLMGLFMFSKLLAPLVWGWIADHSDARLRWIRIAAFLTIIGILPVFFEHHFIGIALAMVWFGFFWNASLPQFEALTLNYLGHNTSRYSWIRLWGSIGFITMVAGLPLVFGSAGTQKLPWLLALFFTLIWLSTFLVTEQSHHARLSEAGPGILATLKQSMVIALFVACIMQTASHGAYYTFFSIFMDELGYSRVFTGWLWALGVIAEVFLFIIMYRLFACCQAYQLFHYSLLLTVIRWILLALLADNLLVLVLSQLFHAASYGLFHASAIQLVHDWFPGSIQGRGQSLYAGLSFGFGGAAGSLISGYLWEFNGATSSFMVMALMAFAGWLVAVVFIRKSHL